jgi:hypothetical protein
MKKLLNIIFFPGMLISGAIIYTISFVVIIIIFGFHFWNIPTINDENYEQDI